MRASTFIFLAIFGAFVFHDRIRSELGPPLRLACSIAGEPATARAIDTSCASRVREIESELSRLERRGRDLERSLQSVTQSARALKDLADRHGDAAVRAECAEIEAGRDRLKQMRDRVEVDRVTLAARLQLARAGIEPAPRAAPHSDERRSPVDALSDTAPRSRVTSRSR